MLETTIDDEKVFLTLPQAISDFKEYIKQVDEFLDKNDGEDRDPRLRVIDG